MTTLKDYKENVLKEFREKYIREDGLLDIGKYDQDSLESFLSLAIDNAVAEAFKAVEVENTRCDYCSCNENQAFEEVEDRKKQYLV